MIRFRTHALVALVLAIGATAAVQPASGAGKQGRTGVYVGQAVHPPFFGNTELEPYKTRLVVRVNRGVVTGISVEARMECPNTAIQDVEYHSLVMPKDKRPELNKNDVFHLRKNGIHIAGHVGKNFADGSISAHGSGCKVSGVTWTAARKKF